MSLWRPARTILAVAASLLAAMTSAPAADPPVRRVVSANLCADRLVLQLTERAHVVSVSRYAADPAASTVADLATDIPVNQGGAEDIVILHPDLVVLGAVESRPTAAMLRAQGIKVHVLPVAESVAEARAAIAGLATALGEPEQGERLIRAMDARLATLPTRSRPARAAVYQAGGWSAGAGTMADDLFRRIGFVNVAAEAGIAGFGALPLETLVAARPDLIVFEAMGNDGPPSVADELLHHPALSGGIRPVFVPMRLWACPDPALVDAAFLIAGAVP